MPYTPPSHRSPASSASTSPDVSRRSSIASAPGQRPPSLPRSASYLNKHRRTPSVSSANNDAASAPSPPYGGSDEELKSSVTISSSIRKSPPPVTDDRGMPNAAIISPPDSASSGSEDEGQPEIRGRKLENLKDLRNAVSQISQPRTPSPNLDQASNDDSTLRIMRTSFSTTSLGSLPKSVGRKISHVRSATEPSATFSLETSSSVSDESEEDIQKKPQMVRKKSGELVRPALRPAHRRPSSMPGTPVFAKAVHFDSHLEHVRHFLQVDRPLAVSAGSSPVDNYESDTEYPFPGGQKSAKDRSPPFEWELVTTKFPHSALRKDLPVKLEKVWLSVDQKSMYGSVAVQNLDFHKSVVCRFTLDYWKTTSEVVAEYSHEIRPQVSAVSSDRFTFSIKLSDTINLESKTLFFCIRYNVNGQEFWDNNDGSNFQVDFRKKHKPQNGKNNFQGAGSKSTGSLPRSNRRQNPSTAPRPVSMPVGFDAFGIKNKPKFSLEEDDQPIHDYLGESGAPGGLRLKTKSTSNLASDNLTKGMTSPSGAAFANRYDFGASLAAAQAGKDITPIVPKDRDALYMKRNVRGSGISFAAPPVKNSPVFVPNPPVAAPPPATSVGLASSSYEELVSKYCFFGSKQSSSPIPPFSGAGQNTGFDGVKPEPEAPTMSIAARRTGPAAHHGLHLRDLNPHQPASTIYAQAPIAPLKTWPIATPPSKPQSASPVAIVSARPQSPSVSVTGTSPSDRRLHMPQQMRPQRFPWGGDAHASAAIRG